MNRRSFLGALLRPSGMVSVVADEDVHAGDMLAIAANGTVVMARR